MKSNVHVGYYIYEHRLPIFAGLMALITAAVKTAPVPTHQSAMAYTWVYDFSHQMLNITNTRLSPVPVITPPESGTLKDNLTPQQ